MGNGKGTEYKNILFNFNNQALKIKKCMFTVMDFYFLFRIFYIMAIID